MSDLTTVKKRISREFGCLQMKDWEEIEAAKPPHGKLYRRFKAAVLSLPPKAQQNRCLAFRGIRAKYLNNIRKNGYNNRMKASEKEEKFMYFATNPDAAKEYCCSKQTIIVNELLLGRDRYYREFGDKIGLMNPYHYALPQFIFTLQ